MCAVILQLKPHQESFYKVVHDKIRGLDAIVLRALIEKLVELNLIVDAITYRDPPTVDRPAAA
jgi:hypothetical protein